MKKRCGSCKLSKPLGEFHKSNQTRDGLQGTCINCRKKQGRIRYALKKDIIIANQIRWRNKNRDKYTKYTAGYRKRNKELIHNRRIFKQYGLTLEEYEILFTAQKGKCAICLKTDFEPKIDHDHLTGKVRGILCFNCNCAIGGLQDSVVLLKAAIKYLNDSNNVTN